VCKNGTNSEHFSTCCWQHKMSLVYFYTHPTTRAHTIKCRPRWHKFLVQYENFHAAEIQIQHRLVYPWDAWTVLPAKRKKQERDWEQSGSMAWLWFRAQPHSKWHLGPFPRPLCFAWFLVISLIGSLLRTSVGHVAVTRGFPFCIFVYLMLSSNNNPKDTVRFVTDTDTFGPPVCLAFSLGVSGPVLCLLYRSNSVFPVHLHFFTRNTQKSNMAFPLYRVQNKYVCAGQNQPLAPAFSTQTLGQTN